MAEWLGSGGDVSGYMRTKRGEESDEMDGWIGLL